jgi:hypothetical protein
MTVYVVEEKSAGHLDWEDPYILSLMLPALLLVLLVLYRPLNSIARKTIITVGGLILLLSLPFVYTSSKIQAWNGIIVGVISMAVVVGEDTFIGRPLLPFIQTNSDIILV